MATASDAAPGPTRAGQELVRDLLAEAGGHPDRFARLVEAAPLPVVVYDPFRVIVRANALAAAFFRTRLEGLVGLPVDEIIPARFRAPAVTPSPPLAGVLQVEVPALARDGTELEAQWAVGSVELPEGLRFVVALRDLAEAERDLAALRRSEERFRLLIESIRDHAILLVDPGGRIASWNPGAARLFGYEAEEILGQGITRFYLAEDVGKGVVERNLEAALREGRSEIEAWHVRRDGSRFWADVVLTRLVDANGRHIGFAKVTHDLTEKRAAEENARRLLEETIARGAAERAEAAAREQARRQRLLADASRLFTSAAMDQPVVLSELARRCAELTGDACTVVVATDEPGLCEIKAVHWTDGAMQEAAKKYVGRRLVLQGLTARVFENGRPSFEPVVHPASFREAREDEFGGLLDRHPVHSLLAVPVLVQGKVLAVATVSRHSPGRPFEAGDLTLMEDLAGRAGLALENGWLYRDLQAAVHARDDLLAVVSHDLRNPLSAMLLSAGQLIHMAPLLVAERTREIGRRIEKAGKRMDRLLQDLLDRARIQSGKPLSVNLAPVEVGPLLAEAAEIFEPMASSARLSLKVEPPPGACRVVCDADRLQQVFSNLLGNAMRHTPENGTVRLAAQRRNGEVLFTVADTGSGIDASLLGHIFDPYWQGSGTKGSLGLGLAVSKAIVDAHRGRIRVESEPGRGTSFFISIPGAD